MIVEILSLSIIKNSFPRRCGGDPKLTLSNPMKLVVSPAGAEVIPPKDVQDLAFLRFPRRCGGDPKNLDL